MEGGRCPALPALCYFSVHLIRENGGRWGRGFRGSVKKGQEGCIWRTRGARSLSLRCQNSCIKRIWCHLYYLIKEATRGRREPGRGQWSEWGPGGGRRRCRSGPPVTHALLSACSLPCSWLGFWKTFSRSNPNLNVFH